METVYDGAEESANNVGVIMIRSKFERTRNGKPMYTKSKTGSEK